MVSVVVTRRKSFWAWPGPARVYELVLVAAIYLPLFHFFGKSPFALSLITALTICATYIAAVFRTDLSAEDWGRLDRWYTIWTIRIAALAAGLWLFSDTPTKIGPYLAVFAYAVLYIICENAAWRRKRAIEAAANSQK